MQEVAEWLKRSIGSVSHHVALLKAEGMVEVRPMGRSRVVSLRAEVAGVVDYVVRWAEEQEGDEEGEGGEEP